MSGWRKRTILDLAREAGFEQAGHPSFQELTARIEAFAKLVRDDECDKWMNRTATLIRGEREACARLCEAEADDGTEGEWDTCCLSLARRIRDRGQA